MARRRRRPVRRTAVLPNDVNAPRQVRRYYAILVEFMEHKNSTEYALDKLFTREELLDITPVHLYRWMCFKTYGREDPGVDDNPIHARSTTMAYWKKAISYFMPNNGQAWTVGARDDGEGFGNPTRSREINRLITAVRRKETRGLGSPSQADRSCTRAEYLQAINLIGSYGTPLERIRHLAMIKFQLHLIGRADDTAHVKKNCLIQSTQFEDYLTVKMRWSKNVQEERDCPFQVILGSMNSKICLVLALALYLEKWLRLGNGVTSQWVFAEGTTIESDDIEDQDNEALNCKQNYTNAIREGILQNDSFVRSAQSGNLGSHSVKKYATTVCRRGGVGKDDIDYRARWKARRMQDRYTDMQLDWPDVRAASKLCDGGTCLYKVKDGLPVKSTNTMSYADAWDVSVGKSTSWIIAFSCFIDCWFGNLSYSMILADTIKNLLASIGIAATRTQSLMGVTGVVLLPLCLMKNLSSLAPFSLVGIIGMLYTTLVMGMRYFGGAYAPGGKFLASALAAPSFGSAGAAAAMSAKTLILTSMLSNAYIAHFNAPKYLAELKNNTMGRFSQVIAWSFGTSITLYSIITAFGFLTFGAASNGLILNNYSTQDVLMSLSRVAVGLSVTGSYPLLFDGARDGFLDLFKVPKEKRTDSLFNKVTIGILAITTLVAAKLTDLGLVASVGGATFGTALVFIYPTIMFLKSQKGKKTKETTLAKVIAVLGVLMGALGTKLALE